MALHLCALLRERAVDGVVAGVLGVGVAIRSLINPFHPVPPSVGGLELQLLASMERWKCTH